MTNELLIQQTLNRYSEAASRGAWDEVLETYIPEGVWEISALNLVFKGHAAIHEAIREFTSTWEYGVQINGGAVIAVEGETAHASSVIREIGKFSGRDAVFETLATYNDELVLTDEGWKFSRRIFQRRGKYYYKVLDTLD